ncbi:MAG TPA: PDGLE domain-containing protein [Ornithinibacter sp.]|nr:PDGLE domain-containing protein [Ornithinibacter sp.]
MSPATPVAAPARRRPSTRSLVVVGLLVSALLAGGLSFYASAQPDGLEHVAGALGFDTTARDSPTAGSPVADYAVADVDDPRLSGGLAGLVGVVVVGLVMTGVLVVVRRRPQTDSAS